MTAAFGHSRLTSFAAGALCALFLASASTGASEIRLAGGVIDASTAPAARAASKRGPVEARTLLIQFNGPIQAGWIADLDQLGVEFHHYLPDYAYLATLPADVLTDAQQHAAVAWIGQLPAQMKMRPRLAARKSSDPPVEATVLSVSPVAGKSLAKIKNASQQRSPAGWDETHVALTSAQLAEIAQMEGVFFIEERPEFELYGERAAQTAAGNYGPGDTAPSAPGFTDWLSSHGLQGAPNLVVQVQDDGLDQGDDSNAPGTAHPDILGRIAGIHNPTSDALGNGVGGHGQLNAGIIMGNAAVGTQDLDGYLFGQGMAPQARVFATKIFRNSGPFDTGGQSFTTLARIAQDAGVTYSNNSWGASVQGAYTAESAEFDALTRDADPNEPGDQPMVYFFAAGNSGPGNNTIGTPASAKNVIAVGATENSDGQTYTDPAENTDRSGVGPTGSDNFRQLSSFTSRGPAADGRYGVTIVAVGTHVSGAASTDPSYTGNTVSDKYWPSGQTDYARSSGTSHSCPVAAGAGMLVHEFFETQLAPLGHTANPSPAMVRAVLTNTAVDLAGNSDGAGGTLTSAPNPQQGWGAVNLSRLFDQKEALYSLDQEEVFTTSGETWSQTVSASDSANPLKITLTWTDAPGSPAAAAALVNDLDLVVEQGDSVWVGNNFSNGVSVEDPNASPDRLNAIEAVYIENPSGLYTVTVRAHNIAGDALPNDGGGLDQDFALFAANCTDQSPRGYVRLDRSAYRCADLVEITVSDSDLRGLGTAQAALSSDSGDLEVVSLAETGPDTGVMVGAIETATGAPAEDSVLQVASGDSLTAVYQDADDGSGQPAEATATASVDCQMPVISGVSIEEIRSTAALVVFQTDEESSAAVRYGTAPDALNAEWPLPGPNVDHAATLRNLQPLTTYHFIVEATDRAGNAAVLDDNGQPFTFTTLERPDYYTEVFDAADFDLAHHTLTWAPDDSSSQYALLASQSSGFPHDPSGGSQLMIGDDDFVAYQLTDGVQIPFYGELYDRIFVGSNGYITFNDGDVRNRATLPQHFASPRIAALLADFDPTAGGTVMLEQTGDRVVITFDAVPEWDSTNSNSFQFELFFNGLIRISYLGVAVDSGIAGLSQGLGLPVDYVESDLSEFEIIDDLEAAPIEPFLPIGYEGGPFGPSAKRYTVQNTGDAAVDWTLSFSAEWLNVDKTGGTLDAGGSTEVVVSLDASANTLAIGSYSDVLAFTNQTSGAVRERNVFLTVQPPPPVIRVETPQPLERVLYPGDSWTFDPGFTIYNDGVDTLDYVIRLDNVTEPGDEEQPAMTPAQAVSSVIQGSGILEGPLTMGEGPTLIERISRVEGAEATLTRQSAVASLRAASDPEPLTAGYDVAVVGADYESALADVQDKLWNSNRFDSVAVINASVVTPTLDELSAFDAVLVFSNNTYADATALGDVVADYADNGGGVVSAVFEIGGESLLPGSTLGGRWTTDGYALMDRTDFYFSLIGEESLGAVHEPDHPLMENVATFRGGIFSIRPATMDVFPGVDLIAEWTDGTPLVAVGERNGAVRAALGFYPVSTDDYSGLSAQSAPAYWDSSTDGDLLLANALNYTAEASVPWLDVERPRSGALPGGGEPHARTVRLDAADLAPGLYTADVIILSDDPETPEVVIPVSLDVRSDNFSVSPESEFVAEGFAGGPFSPASATYTMTNDSDIEVQVLVETQAGWLDISPGEGLVPEGESRQTEVSIGPAAAELPAGQHRAEIVFTNLATRSVATRDVVLNIVQSTAAAAGFGADPGWSTQGEWEFGPPQGLGGIENGHPDPGSAWTGDNVFGVNLAGDYDVQPGGPWYVTAGPFDLEWYDNVHLRFARWLNTDHPLYVKAMVEISSDGSTWEEVWSNPGILTDSQWQVVEYDVSAVADRQQAVYVRWGYEVAGEVFGDDMALPYSGWNIDDVELTGDLDRTDTDGDGISDRVEIEHGSDPTNPNDLPPLPALAWPVAAAVLAAGAAAVRRGR